MPQGYPNDPLTARPRGRKPAGLRLPKPRADPSDGPARSGSSTRLRGVRQQARYERCLCSPTQSSLPRIHHHGITSTYYYDNVLSAGAVVMSKSPPEQDIRVRLAQIRRRLGRSQAEVANSMGTTQSGVSRLERQDDIRVSTLREYAAALGGRLRLIVECGETQFEVSLEDQPDEQRARRRAAA